MQEGHVMGLLTSAIARVRRINYVQPDGNLDANEGPIELTLDNGTVFRLESGADGESMRLSFGEWNDPFAEPLSPRIEILSPGLGSGRPLMCLMRATSRGLSGRRSETSASSPETARLSAPRSYSSQRS
jgi:hypothetical protein